eukprot:5323047-Heterocapsa_arctica.AAC.1
MAGVACGFPGASRNTSEFFAALCKRRGGALRAPEEVFDANPNAPGKMYARHGCFVKSADMFDNAFFGISSPE